jgi:hypothetical protein
MKVWTFGLESQHGFSENDLRSVVDSSMSEHGRASSERDAARAGLVSLREAVLQLHKALVDSERVEYERAFGPIGSANDFLRLLATDPWFAWLSPLTRLLVSMDEAIEAGEPLAVRQMKAMTAEVFGLLVTDEVGEGFGRHYFHALQRDPDVVMAHAAVAKLRPKRTR